MRLRRRLRRYDRVGQAVSEIHVGFGRLEEFAKDGAVSCDELRAVFRVNNEHDRQTWKKGDERTFKAGLR
jgi:hypothetical protein